MRVIRYHEKGGPEVLKLEELDVLKPASGEILIKVDATAVNYGDVLRRGHGYYPFPVTLPHIPGTFTAGTVVECGDGVTDLPVGTRVYGHATSGGYAEFTTGPAAGFTRLPDDVSSVDAVAVLSDGETAAMILKLAGQLKAGQTIFVPAAAGALGSVAVQLAQIYGASRVFAAASSPAKQDMVRGLGATAVFDYTVEGWSKEVLAANDGVGVDLALEMTGGPIFYETLEIVKPKGRVVNYGNASDTDSPVNPRLLLRKNLTLTGFNMGPYGDERPSLRAELITFMAEGRLKANYTIYALEDAAKAHTAIEARKAVGRQIIVP